MRILFLTYLVFFSLACHAQEVFLEASATVGSGEHTPVWLSANRNGLVSPYNNSAYERAGVHGSLNIDSARQLKVDYSLDLQLAQNAQSVFFVHEAFAELSWRKLHFLIGQKEHTLDFRNDRLTSGGLAYGINALPVPKALLRIDYFNFPGTREWFRLGGKVGYGMTTDAKWQKNWVKDGGRYTSNTLYCERALQFTIGKKSVFPLMFEFTLQMMTQFGGTSYNASGRNHTDNAPIVNPQNFNAFWHALWPMGSSDATDGNMSNAVGNTVGSYAMSLRYDFNDKGDTADRWYINAYFERMFEDQSMLTVQYGIYDHLLGLEFGFKKNPFVSHALVEHISSKDQAGPVYHDKSPNIPESYTGIDNYYNHHLFTGWQNWGMGMGNPLYLPPINNADHSIEFYNNRLRALHFGIDGNPYTGFEWRLMASFSRSWGTYRKPYPDIKSQQHYLVEASYSPNFLKGWKATLAYGWDNGSVFGNSNAFQLTIRKTITK